MKPVNLTLLTIPRLKAYRKVLYKKIGPYEMCWCGDPCCDAEMENAVENPKYQFLKAELERVNEALGKRQLQQIKKERKAKWADMVRIAPDKKRWHSQNK